MWGVNSLLVVLGAAGPSVYFWLTHGITPLNTLQTYLATDSVFLLAAIIFLRLGVDYGRKEYPSAAAPYLGAWIQKNGSQKAPVGFAPFYLLFAFVVSFITPICVLLYVLTQPATNPARQLVFESLLPYLLVFVPQMLLETRYMRTTVMAPTIPILFMFYRLWQFIRSLNLTAASKPQEDVLWVKTYLLATLGFWVFDTAAVLTWLPWTYNWQLQPDMTQIRRRRVDQEAAAKSSINVHLDRADAKDK
jgi:hypothetical protein